MEEAMQLRTEKDVKQNSKKRYEPEEEEIEEEYEGYDEDEEEDDYDPKMERLTTALAVGAAVLIGCIVLFLVGRAFGLFQFGSFGKTEENIESEETKEQVTMVEVVGKNIDDVKVELLTLGLTPEIEYQESTQYAAGIVMESSVSAGTLVAEGTNVVLTVSAGSEGVVVPDVVGLTEAEAVSSLEKKGFVVNKTEGFDQYIKEGSIVSQMPEANAKAPAGTAVTICISKGVENAKVRVPDLIGKGEEEATILLVESGLQVGNVSEVNNEDAALTGLVCYQSYSVGSYVEAGTTIDISISLGPVQSTYRFSDSITAPTQEEDPNYRSGTLVTVTLMADDGTQLMSTQTTSFPIQQQNITGIKVSTGYLLFQYQNTTETTSITNEDGSVTTIEGTTQEKEIRRVVTFVQES